MRRSLITCVTILLLAVSTGSLHAAQYQFYDIGAVPNSLDNSAEAINSFGLIAGWSWNLDIINQPAQWSNGTLEYLPVLGGGGSHALGINNQGHTVGDSSGRACVWADGGVQSLGFLPDYTSSRAQDINEAGQVVGYSTSYPAYAATLWQNGEMIDLGNLGGIDSRASGINDSGQIAGFSTNSSGSYRAFLYEDGAMSDLGTLGGVSSQAEGINNLGQVVGHAYTTAGTLHACLWQNGQAIDLGTPQGHTRSKAIAINNLGQIVGYSGTRTYFQDGRPVVWTGGVMQELLYPSDYIRGLALDINDSGWIVGMVDLPTGQRHAALWVPVPEPSSLAVLISGVGGALVWGRRRQAQI